MGCLTDPADCCFYNESAQSEWTSLSEDRNGYNCCIHFLSYKIYMWDGDTRKYSRLVGHYFELTTEDNQVFEIQFNKDDFKHLTGISSLLSNGRFNTKLNSPQTCIVFVVIFKCCIPSNSKIINPFANLHLKLTTYTTLV